MTSSFLFIVSILAFLAVNCTRAQVPGYIPECAPPVGGLLNGGSNPQCSPVPLPTLVPTRSGTKSKKAHVPWRKCSDKNKLTVLDAADDAMDLVTEALDGLRQLNTSRVAMEIYTKWFGVFDQRRFGIVQGIFGKLSTNNFTDYTYICDCDECWAADAAACGFRDT
ncbi:hypothetical protein BDN72DRAFT_134035 [Pluteus cervinus]|uniref:Uncharacterized protein n=1 Tax=Pluteus cervinus TaxID=181527 RepID=A0ACD3AME7_9AGAR|nr:hypothetical protein BDN72DRAFT_134035 [Pluteus cervinus]